MFPNLLPKLALNSITVCLKVKIFEKRSVSVYYTCNSNFYDTMCIFKYLKMPLISNEDNYGEYL